jgi:hypothetical protein
MKFAFQLYLFRLRMVGAILLVPHYVFMESGRCYLTYIFLMRYYRRRTAQSV